MKKVFEFDKIEDLFEKNSIFDKMNGKLDTFADKMINLINQQRQKTKAMVLQLSFIYKFIYFN